jgi:hypothetical protein
MPLNWKSLKPEDVMRACLMLRARQRAPAVKKSGLYVRFEAVDLPAKEVLGVAYRIANGLPPNAKVRFSSGEGTIARLRALGFEAGRKPSTDETGHE